MRKTPFNQFSSRRNFIKLTGLGVAALSLQQVGCSGGGRPAPTPTPAPAIPGLENVPEKPNPSVPWVSVSDRKIRVGLVGYGASKFSAAFGFQNHPNVEVVAVSDLFPDHFQVLLTL